MHSDRNQADAEYAVMLTVLNFQTEFMKSHYNHARVQIHDRTIEVVLTRSAFVPAEEQLAQSPEGRTLLEQVHAELFKTGQSLLRADLEQGLGVKIHHIESRMDMQSRTNTITIQLAEPFNIHTSIGEPSQKSPVERYY
jgi:uncharacterized protein YbcI